MRNSIKVFSSSSPFFFLLQSKYEVASEEERNRSSHEIFRKYILQEVSQFYILPPKNTIWKFFKMYLYVYSLSFNYDRKEL